MYPIWIFYLENEGQGRWRFLLKNGIQTFFVNMHEYKNWRF